MFCRAVLGLYTRTFKKIEFLPECIPGLPDVFLPTSATCQTTVLQLADIFGATNRFINTEEMVLSESRDNEDQNSSF